MTQPSPRGGPGLAETEAESDAALVALARAGDRAAFGLLHSRFARPVHGLLLAHATPSDAEDLLQEVFLSAWRQLAQLREPERFGSWLLTIARNAATDAARRTRPTEAIDGEAAGPDHGATADGLEILAQLRELPEAYRETLALRLIEGLSGPEIAAATGLTHGSVRVNLHRGMQLLRERLRREGYA